MSGRMKSLCGRYLSQPDRRMRRTRPGRIRHRVLQAVLTALGVALTVWAAGCVPVGKPPRESTAAAPQAARPPLTVYAPYFDFPEDPEPFYLLLYAGSGGSFSDLRTAFERGRLSDIDRVLRSDFAVCDLGGDDLILVVPRYAGTSVTVRTVFSDASGYSGTDEIG